MKSKLGMEDKVNDGVSSETEDDDIHPDLLMTKNKFQKLLGNLE